MNHRFPALFAIALAASVTMVHAQDQPQAVTDRQELMKTIGAQTKILGTIAKSGSFDAVAVSAAATTLHDASMKIADLFEENVTSAKSEAKPEIWADFADFTAKSEKLQLASMTAMDATDAASLGAAMGQIGGACKACHEVYRQEKK